MVSKKNIDHVENSVGKAESNDVIEVPVGKYFGNLRTNPWIAATVVLGVFLVLILIFGAGASGGEVSADQAGQKVLTFLNSNPQITGQVDLVSAKQDGQFYQVMLSYQGQQVPVYTTLDGKFLVGNPVSLSNEQKDENASADSGSGSQVDASVTKSDKPKVELFVMAYCPYGTQIEKGVLPVATLLGNKVDFSVKFVDYAMHGEKEVKENLNQYCIEKEQNSKYLDYLQCFLNASDGEGCLVKAKIDKTKLSACTAKADKEFAIMDNFKDQSKWLNGQFPQFNIYKAENDQYGVQGSPTLVINGKQASSGRDPASLLGTICNAFNNAPEECGTVLSSASPSAGFGWATTSADSAAAAQCG